MHTEITEFVNDENSCFIVAHFSIHLIIWLHQDEDRLGMPEAKGMVVENQIYLISRQDIVLSC